jgi:lysophospholipid acyltransferase (LPLAT)-like uncharacterized protein
VFSREAKRSAQRTRNDKRVRGIDREVEAMKIRHPALIRGLGCVGSWAIRGLVGSLRYRYRALDPLADPDLPGQDRRFVYAFWHDSILLPSFLYGGTPTKVLISQHADGELITQICRHLRFDTVRGSTTRGGIEAVRQILKLGGKYNIVVTPDGPRGPRRQVQPGLVYLAARTGMSIVPVGFAFHRCWQLNSWDRFSVPWPFSPAVGVIGHPLAVPTDASRADLETYRLRAQQAMDETTSLAEEWAARERW